MFSRLFEGLDKTIITPSYVVGGFIVVFLAYHAVRAIYLIYLSPLAIFPGSPWAALGEYWEAYWNIGLRPGHKGQTLFKLEQMHRTLAGGSALRMGPNEVHVYDPRFYHELYRLGSKYYKDPTMHKVLGAPSSTLAEADPIKHKQRRAPLDSLFAKKNILQLEPMLMEHVDYCSKRFDEFYEAGRPVLMEWALKSLAMDMVSEFCFGKSLKALDDPEFKSLPVQVFAQFLPSLHVIKAFPFVRWLNELPLWVARRISHAVEMGHELEAFAARRIDEYMALAKDGKKAPFPTIMERLLIPIPEKGYEVPNRQGMRDELLTVISAGDDTTGIANTVTIFNIINNSKIHDRLLTELKTVMPHPDSHVAYPVLEQLPYLVNLWPTCWMNS